jgi:hypothetical protein
VSLSSRLMSKRDADYRNASSSSPSAPSLTSADESSKTAVAGPGPSSQRLNTIIDVDHPATPSTMTGQDVGSTSTNSTYNGYARSRGKPLTQTPIYNNNQDSSEDLEYALNTDSYPKVKRKKSRGSSFSLPFHRRQRISNGGIWRLVVRQMRRITRYGSIKVYSALLFFGLIFLFYNWWMDQIRSRQFTTVKRMFPTPSDFTSLQFNQTPCSEI